MDLPVVEHPPKLSADPSTWKCFACELTSNLWLNLSTGVMACGRQQMGGAKGYGHALRHFEETGSRYPLCVKLGTVTADSADVYSYHPDENDLVLNSKLDEHLARFGLDRKSMVKTDKSMDELQLDAQEKLESNRITEAGKKLMPVPGAGFVGLKNMGNSCYMASAVQCLAAMPEFAERYLAPHDEVLGAIHPRAVASDLTAQTCKLARALITDKYVPEDKKELPPAPSGEVSDEDMEAYEKALAERTESVFVEPRMFRFVAGAGHPDFGGTQQQDVSMYMTHLFEQFALAEAKGRPGKAVADRFGGHLGRLFAFDTQDKIKCLESGTYRLKDGEDTMFSLGIPMDKATNKDEYDAFMAREAARKAQREAKKQAKAEAEAKARAGVAAAMAAGKGDGEKEKEKGGEKEQEKEKEGGAKREEEAASASSGAGTGASTTTTTTTTATTTSASTSTDASLKEEEQVLAKVPWSAVMEAWAAGSVVPDLHSNATGKKGPHLKTPALKTMPPYLLVQLRRYSVGPDYQPIKLGVSLDVPQELDMEKYRAKPLGADEPAMPEGDGGGDAAGGGAGEQEVSPEILAAVTGMGFTENAAKRAAKATGNGPADAAVNWLMEHMGDPDINDPMPAAGAGAGAGAGAAGGDGVDESKVQMLQAMGFDAPVCRKALHESKGDAERASMWIMERMEDIAAGTVDLTIPKAVEVSKDKSDGPGKYRLMAFISHIGRSTTAGHYVCHVKKGPGGAWVVYNDRKVALSEEPPFGEGFLYFYQRVDRAEGGK